VRRELDTAALTGPEAAGSSGSSQRTARVGEAHGRARRRPAAVRDRLSNARRTEIESLHDDALSDELAARLFLRSRAKRSSPAEA
jgi:hypothetical protein